MSTAKYYVVWKGRSPGVYDSWAECERQVKGFGGAEYRGFPSREQAEAAFRGAYADYKGKHISKLSQARLIEIGQPLPDSYAVDAACSSNPGPLEYRCVHIASRRELFREGPFADGTNNVGEFLGLAHVLALFKQKEIRAPIYSDSETALGWLKDKRCRTQLLRTERNEELFRLIERAENWLQANPYPNRVLKWETEAWGESPADFGRK